MPAPTNTTIGTATDVGALPASISQNVHDAGTTYSVWYKYTATARGSIGVFGFGDLVGYSPTIEVWTGTAASPVYADVAAANRPVQVVVTSGETYFFRFITNSGSVSPAVLTLSVEAGPDTTSPIGSLLVPDETPGKPAIVASTLTDYLILQIVSPFPAGEEGDILHSAPHVLLMEDDSTSNAKLYDQNLQLLATVAVDPGSSTIRANQTLRTFLVGVPGGVSPSQLQIVSDTGALGATYTLPPLTGIGAAAASQDNATIYITGQAGPLGTAITRFDTATATIGSDLAAGVAGYFVRDLLVLTDDTIVALYAESAAPHEMYAVRFATDGSVLNTYPLETTAVSSTGKLAIALDDPVSFWAWNHPTLGLSRFRNVRASDGVVLTDRLHAEYVGGGYAGAQTATPPGSFGVPNSCPFMVLPYTVGTGTIQVDKETVPDASAQSFDFTAGGGLAPATFSLTDGTSETFAGVAAGSGYTIAEAAVAGWSTSFSVSNGSPQDNIAVAIGETVVVTVTNTQAAASASSTGPCCATTGPGGAPTSTGYNGTGSTSGNGTTPPTNTPRIVPPGGAAPSYTTCNAGGGAPATASDPVDAQDLTTCKTPLVHMKWTLPDASVRRYGKRAFTSGNGQAVSARVLRWGGMSQVLSDRHGSFQANQFTVTLSDYDRAIRTILATASTKYIDGKEVEILIESAANAALSVNPLVLARGVVTDYKFRPDMTVDLTVTDPLGYRYSSVSIDRPIPARVCRTELFPNLPEEATGRAMPIIYGEVSDDYVWTLKIGRVPVGIVPVIYVGKANTIPGVGIPDSAWEAFLIAGHAISCVQSVFASNLDDDAPGPVRMATSTYGTEFKVPGVNVPLYYDIVGSDGVTERVCLLFVSGARATAHIDGTIPITVNVWGIEDVGDGSGDTITEIALQFQHFLQHWIVQNYLTGSWGSVPAFGDGTAKVRTSSFSAVNAIHAARMGTVEGYVGGMYIADQKPAREWAKEFQTGGDMRLGVNHQGQLLVTTLDHTQSTSGLTTFTARDEMVQQSFQIDPQVSEIFNVYSYEFGVEPATGRKSGISQTIRHAASITNHGERVAQASVNRATNRDNIAADVANRALLKSYDAPTDVSFDLDLRGTALTLGEIVKVTHYQGVGALGWTDRNLVVTGTTAYPDEDNFSTSIELEDWHDVLALGGSALAIDTGTIDTSTIG
jgi:hypothetical protein